MQEIKLEIEGFDPIEIFGVNNSKLKIIKKYFPKLKILSRGNQLTAVGDEEELLIFDRKIKKILAYLAKYNQLRDEDIDNILLDQDDDYHKIKNDQVIVHGVGGAPIKARTLNQRKLVDSIIKNDMVFAVGPAGTGKTYTAVAMAVRALKNKEVKRIILTRPAVEAGENLGFLPGDLKDKLDPYLQPLYDGLRDMIPPEKLAEYLEFGTIQIAPLAFMRGRTLDKAFVILDEAQNATYMQMKMFLTRMGQSAKFVVTGDMTQVDLPKHQKSGLLSVINKIKDIKGIEIIELNKHDVIRHKLVSKIIQALEDDKE
ncbi:MAG: PhoH family protein [Crocinitomicaceae bacterium]|nr:PhoH family protein [Crocinitomicaceae bacterium]